MTKNKKGPMSRAAARRAKRLKQYGKGKNILQLTRQKYKNAVYEIELAPDLKIGTGLLNDPIALTEALKIINARSKYNITISGDGEFIVTKKNGLS